ncbi:aldose 1-epimerase [Planoprotostelium fungivorum]|uniref:Aldose 1-epimerase n=1 Tax=Planoprotostelium fungivorum TaxID=1890364 RepID=A0A2P6NQ50_9EUKA|nr:aldose 1-epimerase [Planoprotostelium fungivorum]
MLTGRGATTGLLLILISLVVCRPTKHTIQAEGIKAQFVNFGASITNLWVPDRDGRMTDVVLGFDQASTYSTNHWKPRYGPVVGRYANRIRNGTFTIDNTTYHVPCNENNGKDTLHGGTIGYDAREFHVVKKTRSSITFSLNDPDDYMGFPGKVLTLVTYTVEDGGIWTINMTSYASEKTPIMLSSHTYWNLDAFMNPETNLIVNHTLHLPRSSRRIGVDDILVPTGDIIYNNDTVNNFTSPQQIGAGLYNAVGECGTNCTGYDTAYIIDEGDGPVASLWSDFSGIRVSIETNQNAFQVYSCNGMNGSIPLKSTQRSSLNRKTVPKYGCLVMEVEGWIDGINHPEWPIESQIYGPGRDYHLTATHRFTTEEVTTVQYLLSLIFSGGFGCVYRAKSDDRDVIIKTVRKTRYSQAMVDREYSLGVKLDHPHVVKTRSRFESKEEHCLVMDLVEGENLFQYLVQNGFCGVEESRAKKMFRGLSKGLEHCHSRGIAHMDIKPENIMVSRGSHLTLIDFGLAVESTPRCDQYLGSPDYVAPEVWRGFPFDPCASDVWSLGVVLFIALTGGLPFDPNSVKFMRATPELNWTQDAEISDDVRELVEWMLEVRPLARPTMKEVLSHKWFRTTRQCLFGCFSRWMSRP